MRDPAAGSDARHLTDLAWLRALARSLARNADAADDIAQDACVATVRLGTTAVETRAFGAAVVRNLWKQALRSTRRRRDRETRAARAECVSATDDLVARAETQRALMAQVLALDEPYRSTVLLRFFEGLAPREIARRAGVPAATVQSRLTRALQMLRARLDATQGRHQWLGALAPLGAAPWWPVTITTAIGIPMKTKTAIVAAAVAVAVSVSTYATLAREGTSPREDDAGDARVAGRRDPGAAGSSGGMAAGESDRAERRAPVRLAAPAPASGAPETGFCARGTVYLADGTLGPGIALALREAPAREVVRSGPGGAFELQTHISPATLVAADPGHVTLREGVCTREAAQPAVVVVASAYDFGGRVVDEHQRPLPGAHLRLSLPRDWSAEFATDMQASQARTFTARTAAAGRFTFSRVPDLPGCTLRVVLDGYDSVEVAAPPPAHDDLEIVLRRPTVATAGALRGRVLTHLGEGAGGARVALGLTSVVADERGFFTLDLARAVTAEQLRAVLQGFQPAVLDRDPGASWPDYVELHLGPPALSIAGIVVDHEGQPVEGAHVWLADATTFGMLGMMPMQCEALAGGAAVPPQALESAANLPEKDGDDDWDYHMTKPPPLACWNYATTDGGGHFEIPGLAARAYRLCVLVSATLQTQTTATIEAGTHDARIALERPEAWSTFAGRVVSAGVPVADVDVSLRCDAHAVRARAFGGRVELRFDFPGARTRTDREGRFTLRDVPKHGCFVVLRGETIVPRRAELEATMAGGGTDFVVEGRCQLRVDLGGGSDRADAVALTDGDGKPLDLLVLSVGSTNAVTDLPLHAGKSEVFSCSTRARNLLLLKDGEVADTLALPLLHPGDAHTIGR
ncbi:MAG: sigma-70 family RNA polymerase sigma factor [Planctomycetota bacterium]